MKTPVFVVINCFAVTCPQLVALIAAVADDALTASSSWSTYYGPARSRLHTQATSWVAQQRTADQYIQVK